MQVLTLVSRAQSLGSAYGREMHVVSCLPKCPCWHPSLLGASGLNTTAIPFTPSLAVPLLFCLVWGVYVSLCFLCFFFSPRDFCYCLFYFAYYFSKGIKRHRVEGGERIWKELEEGKP